MSNDNEETFKSLVMRNYNNCLKYEKTEQFCIFISQGNVEIYVDPQNESRISTFPSSHQNCSNVKLFGSFWETEKRKIKYLFD